MGKRRAKAVDFPVPQSAADATDQLAEIGNLRRSIDRREADMNDHLAEIKAAVESAVQPDRERLKGLEEGLQVWAEANRAALTNGGKSKTADLGTGKVLWRQRPPSVSIRKVADVIDRLKAAGLQRFIRVKSEPNKEAMLEEPEAADAIEGIRIVQGEEDFVIEPYEAEVVR